jgi:uncharacterized membrane protein YhaH (DUF805 family)
MFLTSLRHNLANLLRFSGRDAQGQFWPYAFTSFVLAMVTMSVAMQGVMGAFRHYAMAHPERTTVAIGNGGGRISVQGNPPELGSAIQVMMTWTGAIALVFIALIAAAVARRLHDRGRTALWGALPAGLITTGMIGMSRLFGQTGPDGLDGRLFFLIFCNNLAYIASLLYLIVLLAGPGTAGPNEFGPGREPD